MAEMLHSAQGSWGSAQASFHGDMEGVTGHRAPSASHLCWLEPGNTQDFDEIFRVALYPVLLLDAEGFLLLL